MKEKPSEKHMALAQLVRDSVNVANGAIKTLLDEGVEVEFWHNGKKLPDGVFGMDFEVRMLIPREPIQL